VGVKFSLKRISFVLITALLLNQVIPLCFRALIYSPIPRNLGSFIGSLVMGGSAMICYLCRPITCKFFYDYTLTKEPIPLIYTISDFFLAIGVAVFIIWAIKTLKTMTEDQIQRKFDELDEKLSNLAKRSPLKAYFVRLSVGVGISLFVILAVILSCLGR